MYDVPSSSSGTQSTQTPVRSSEIEMEYGPRWREVVSSHSSLEILLYGLPSSTTASEVGNFYNEELTL
ncbi:hypothetical protein GBA52_015626 [Prunus armeniaca]|nr:hypothetical protein GBA52_015626 [Prunus armeniaca]